MRATLGLQKPHGGEWHEQPTAKTTIARATQPRFCIDVPTRGVDGETGTPAGPTSLCHHRQSGRQDHVERCPRAAFRRDGRSARTDGEKSKVLCGHDERHWFVAAVPEDARGVTGVVTAKDALQPQLVRDAVQRFAQLPADRRRDGGWARMTRDPELYAKGAVRHPDHATITLRDWHRVLMNTERGARAMRHVAFLD